MHFMIMIRSWVRLLPVRLMRALSLLLGVALPCGAWSFLAPATPASRLSHGAVTGRRGCSRRGCGALTAVVDPNEVVSFIPHLTSSSVEGAQWLLSTLQGVADAAAVATEAAADAAPAAAQAAKDNGGLLGGAIGVIESSISVIHKTLEGVGLENTYGLSIIAFTLFIKLITLPLNYKQIESTTKMQMIQPKMKELQQKYKSNPQMQQQMLAKLYEDNNVNPLAGCLPALVQIPVFISLYRALTNLAAENELNEPFLWLPNLEGPTYGAAPSEGMAWLTKNWDGLTPPLGWHDTIAFLSIPLILTVSQSISQKFLQPAAKPDDPAAQSQWILKFLPFMVGYFSLNVPSGLGVYWITNNLVTTVTTLAVREILKNQPDEPVAVGGSRAAVLDVEDEGKKGKRPGFGKAPPPPPPKPVKEEEEEAPAASGSSKSAPAAVATKVAPGSRVEVVKQEGGMTLLREVKDGKVVSTTVRLTPEELKKRKEAAEREAAGDMDGVLASSSSSEANDDADSSTDSASQGNKDEKNSKKAKRAKRRRSG